MIVNMSMILDGIGKILACEKGPSYSAAEIVEKVSFLREDTDTSAKKNTAYLTSVSTRLCEEKCIPSENLIVIVREANTSELPNCALVIISEKPSKAVLELIQGVLADYQRWVEMLWHHMMGNSTIEELVECCHEKLQNPIIVMDSSMKMLSYSVNDVMEDHHWEEVKRKGYLGSRNPMSKYIPILLDHLEKNDDPYQYFDNSEHFMTAKSVKVNSLRVGIIFVMSKHHIITDGEVSCLKYFGDIMALFMREKKMMFSNMVQKYGALIIEILNNELHDEEEIRNRLLYLNWELKQNMFIVVIQTMNEYLTGAMLQKFRDDIVMFIPDCRAAIYQSDVVVFLNHNGKDPIPSKELLILKNYLHDNNLVAGISEPSESITNMRKLYRQAQAAIRIGERIDSKHTIYFYKVYLEYNIIDTCLQHGEAEDFIHPCIRLLQKYDTENNTSLWPTLSQFLKNDGNQLQTAKDLFIQRASLLYRLRKIEKICDVDIWDRHTLHYLQLSNMFLEYAKT